MAQDTLVNNEKKEEKELKGAEGTHDGNTFGRVKERLSLRKSKKEKVPKNNEEQNGTKESQIDKKDKRINVDEEIDGKDGNKENFIQKVINFFSKKNKNDVGKKENKDVSVSEEAAVLPHASEVPAVEEPEEETPKEPSPPPTPRPVTPAAKPPPGPSRSAFLSSPPRPPSSATATQSRPLSQLDAALRNFKETTAASRENLRSSHQDLRQVEQQVRTMATTLSRNNSLRRGVSGNTTIPITLSASLTDLRRRQAGMAEASGMDRASVCVN